MRNILKFLITIIFVFYTPVNLYANINFAEEPAVEAFIDAVCIKYAFDKEAVVKVFADAVYSPLAIELMDRPAESLDWGSYMQRMITDLRTLNGVKYYRKYRKTLLKAQKQYGVSAQIIAGILGVETNYGAAVLRYRAVDALATLSFFYPRRAAFFKSELESLIALSFKNGIDPFFFMSSYAGAIGMPQFMPGNISKYAVDGDNDGKIDIINNHADAIFSVANYLNKFGWKANQPVSTMVRFKGKNYQKHIQKTPCGKEKTTVNTLRKAGVIFPINVSGSAKAVLFSMELVGGEIEYHVAFDNFCVINRYNPSSRYVMAVEHLAGKIGRQTEIKSASR